jgi:hypothetical protein
VSRAIGMGSSGIDLYRRFAGAGPGSPLGFAGLWSPAAVQGRVSTCHRLLLPTSAGSTRDMSRLLPQADGSGWGPPLQRRIEPERTHARRGRAIAALARELAVGPVGRCAGRVRQFRRPLPGAARPRVVEQRVGTLADAVPGQIVPQARQQARMG